MKSVLHLLLVSLWSAAQNGIPCVTACDGVLPSITVSPPDGLITFNDVDSIGGLALMDKIVQIEVFAGDGFISRIQTTYLRPDGQTTVISNGNEGTLVGSVEFDEGQYLNQVELSVGLHVEHIRFCRTDGTCMGSFGYHTEKAPDRTLYKSRSVIKAFLGQAGSLIDRLGVYFETDTMYKTEIGEITYQNITTPAIISDLTFESPKAKFTVDNLDGSVEESTAFSFTETMSTSETTVVTKTKQIFGSISLMTSPGFLYEASVGDASVTFSLGTSFSPELPESNTKDFETAILGEYTVNAPPYSLVTGQVYWHQIKYAYHWKAPIQCFFNFDPNNAIDGGTIEGDLYGSQAFPKSYVKFSVTVVTVAPKTTGVPPPVLPPPVSPPVADKVPPVLTPVPVVITPPPSVAPTEGKKETDSPTRAPKKPKATKVPSPVPLPILLTDMPSPVPPPFFWTDMPSSPPVLMPDDGNSGEKDDNLGVASGSFAVSVSFWMVVIFLPFFKLL